MPPLDERRLNELALRYVGRFATTRAKLRSYLARKLDERGWDGERDPDPEAIAERFAAQGYVDDSSYALAKSQSLTGRGYGKRRVVQALRAAGIDDEHGAAAHAHAEDEAVSAALKFARRRRSARSPIRIREIHGSNRRPSPRWSARGTASSLHALSSLCRRDRKLILIN